jgi:hypothetical protein
MVQFPLVRWSVIVCSCDDIGTQTWAVRAAQLVDTSPNTSGGPWQQCKLPFSFIGTARTPSRCYDVPMKGNNMTNQNQPGQQNQGPGQKPGQQQGGGSKPGQQSQAPGKDNRNPKEQLDQTSDTDT